VWCDKEDEKIGDLAQLEYQIPFDLGESRAEIGFEGNT